MVKDTSLLKFPCDFPIKIIGHSADDFEITVAMIVRKHFPSIGENALQARSSQQSNYLSITATVHVKNKKELDDLYRELSANEKVLMVL